MSKYYLYGWWDDWLVKTLTNSELIGVSKVLILYHAKDFSKWNIKFTEDYNFLKNKLPGFTKIEMGDQNLDLLINQIKNSDLIVIKWWSSLLLKENLSPIKDILERILKTKIVIWISAGAYILCEKFYSNDRKIVDDWFGILRNIFLICHYDESLKDIGKEFIWTNFHSIRLAENQTHIIGK